MCWAFLFQTPLLLGFEHITWATLFTGLCVLPWAGRPTGNETGSSSSGQIAHLSLRTMGIEHQHPH